MDTTRPLARVTILSLASGSAFADAGGPGIEFTVTLAVAYYVFLCLLTIPLALALRLGDVLARVFIGVTAPIFGLVMAFAVLELSKWARSYAAPFFVLSALPTICLAFFPVRTPLSRSFSAIRITLIVLTLVVIAAAVIADMVND